MTQTEEILHSQLVEAWRMLREKCAQNKALMRELDFKREVMKELGRQLRKAELEVNILRMYLNG